MKQFLKQATQKILLVAFVAAGFSACDSALVEDQDNNAEIAQLSASVSDELSLSDEQESAFNASLSRHGGDGEREAGYLWRVAADAQANWTDEQKAALFEGTENIEGGLSFRGLLGHPGAGGFYGLGGFIGGSRHHGVSQADSVLNLTSEQEESLQTIHETYREQFKALAESFRNEEITEDDFAAQMIALRTAKRAEIEAVLTAEQLAALETYREERLAEFEAFREEVYAVRDEVLGLTTEQAEAINALYAEQLEMRESLVEQLQAGTLTYTELQAEIEALETAREEVLVGLLDETQYEIVQIHDALSVRSGKFGHRGRRGKFGHGKGHGHTFHG